MLLDTSGLLAIVRHSEAEHEAAVDLYLKTTPRVTHSYILAEFIAVAHTRGVRRDVALEFSERLLDAGEVEVRWITEDLHRQALDLLMARSDKTYSLCDAASFVIMQQSHFSDALTTDRHFEQEGFRCLLRNTKGERR
ncbi:MAG TPA: PIN domain-containing protein [Pirellulaceae bacterium]|jgi:predicted nucleic acid-binding protein